MLFVFLPSAFPEKPAAMLMKTSMSTISQQKDAHHMQREAGKESVGED
jgi:hypothetical protein